MPDAPRNALAKKAPAPANATAKKSTWYDPALDVIFNNLTPSKMGLPARTFLETVQGDKRPITEKNFTPEQIAIIADLVRIAGPGNPIQYDTYSKLYKERRAKTGKIPIDTIPGLSSQFDPIGQIQPTLGQFTAAQTPDGLRIVDSYDFSPSGWDTEGGPMMGPYGAIRSYASRKIPPGQGRKVDVRIRGARQ